jgi:hypothetical protein
MQSVSYQRKVGDYFFPELLVELWYYIQNPAPTRNSSNTFLKEAQFELLMFLVYILVYYFGFKTHIFHIIPVEEMEKIGYALNSRACYSYIRSNTVLLRLFIYSLTYLPSFSLKMEKIKANTCHELFRIHFISLRVCVPRLILLYTVSQSES